MTAIQELLQDLFGLGIEPKSFTVWQMVVRAAAIYLIGWLFLRVGEHRFLGKNTAFDIVLGFVFGSLLSRAINGSAPLYETIVASAGLLFMHWLFLIIAFHSKRMDLLINGKVRRLIEDGKLDRNEMRRARMTDRILRENLRLNGGVSDPSAVKEADFELSGNVSVVPRKGDVRVLDVRVKDGVQTVRVELS